MADKPLKNRYLLMRHGKSTANVLRTIASNPANALIGSGLSSQGRSEVTALAKAIAATIQRESTVVYSSDLRRASESAVLLADILQVPHFLTVGALLRERNFGYLEGLSTDFYGLVWAMDERGASFPGVESPPAVLARMKDALAKIEANHSGRTVIIVSHGDPLQILLADNILGSPLRHRELSPLHTAELRTLPDS